MVLGEPLRAGLAGSARTAAMAVLHARGLRGHVQARVSRAGVEVVVVLDPGTPRVRELRLSVG